MGFYSKFVLAWLLTLACGFANATVVCVHDQAGLDQAAAQATVTPMTVQIVRGTYRAPPAWYTQTNPRPIQGGTDFLGGYDPGVNCATRGLDGTQTVILDSNTVPGAGTGAAVVSLVVTGDLVFEELRLQMQFGMTIYAPDNANAQMLFRRDYFQQSFLQVFWSQEYPGGNISVANTLFAGSNVPSYAGCGLRLQVDAGSPDVVLVNNTFVQTSDGSEVCFLNNGSSGAVLYADSNIFWGAMVGFSDFQSNSANMHLVDNWIDKGSYPNPVQEVGTQSGDPKLRLDYHPVVSPPSPVINTGDLTPYGGLAKVDLAGNPRLVGTQPDRGAFESAVDNTTSQTVINTNDSGTGSLRAAINSANSSAGFTAIKFHIGNDCSTLKVIKLLSKLPDITQSLSIDGSTQPGASANTTSACIALDGSVVNANALHVPAGVADGMHVRVSDLGFEGFGQNATVRLDGGSAHVITGNFVGSGAMNGLTIGASGFDIGPGVHDVQIGSDEAAGPNHFGLVGNPVRVLGASGGKPSAHDNAIRGNVITAENVGTSIMVAGHDNILANNLVGASQSDAILLTGTDAYANLLTGNQLGTIYGTSIGNKFAGVRITGGAHDNTLRGNDIQNNDAGVVVESGLHNKLRANSIANNTTLGIDLGGDGVTDNDDDSDIGALLLPNRGLNFPDLTYAAGTNRTGEIDGTLQSTKGSYIVDVYASATCDGNGHGEGAQWIASKTLSIDPIANLPIATAAFKIYFFIENGSPALPGNAQITATTTDADGNTSEFSQCARYLPDEIFADGFGS